MIGRLLCAVMGVAVGIVVARGVEASDWIALGLYGVILATIVPFGVE